jgi:hypothetical protein
MACAGWSSASAQWAVDAGVEQFDWREHTTPIVVHENGPRFFGGLGFMQPKQRGILFAYHGAVYGGSIDYSGSFQFDATKAASGASNYVGTAHGVEARWRWPGAADAVLGIDADFWTRQLSQTQEEKYRIVSLRLGAEHVASATSRVVAGAGMRLLVDTHEDATIEEAGVTYALALSPGLGASPFAHAGWRVMPHVTLLGYWDGMSLGRSNRITLLKRGKPRAVVSQPDTDVSRLGVRVAYGW